MITAQERRRAASSPQLPLGLYQYAVAKLRPWRKCESETAEQLQTTVSSVNSLLHRARERLRGSYQPRTSRPPDAATARLLRRYVQAWEANDVDALLALLTRDAIREMPPIPDAVLGPTAIRGFLAESILGGTPGRWHGVTSEANGGPAVGLYQRRPGLVGLDPLEPRRAALPEPPPEVRTGEARIHVQGQPVSACPVDGGQLASGVDLPDESWEAGVRIAGLDKVDPAL